MNWLTSFRSLEAAKPETSNPTVRRVTRCAMTQTKRTQLNETRKKGNPPTGLRPDGRGRKRDGRPKKDPPKNKTTNRNQTRVGKAQAGDGQPPEAHQKRNQGGNPTMIQKRVKTYKNRFVNQRAKLPLQGKGHQKLQSPEAVSTKGRTRTRKTQQHLPQASKPTPKMVLGARRERQVSINDTIMHILTHMEIEHPIC